MLNKKKVVEAQLVFKVSQSENAAQISRNSQLDV